MRGTCLRLLPFLAACLFAATTDPWTPAELTTPAAFAANMGDALVIHVGFPVLYHGAHIQGSIFAGPGSKAEGLDALRKAVDKEPRDRQIVLYCGCCPWDHCPNIRPAFAELKKIGFTHVRALEIPNNLKADWVDHGYPSSHGDSR